MRTTLEVSFAQSSTIPYLYAHAHDLPGFPNITCIDFVNTGNKELPDTLMHIMLVPDDVRAPDLGRDRILYVVPANYCEVDVHIALGIVEDKDFVAAPITIKTVDGETVSHMHIPCELL
ncbi:MAG: hypothetical protein KBC62_03295 [Candidatus Pacebacteria bacterium]|nr:hypothetical protein [Candidatus Paceibacterota bacterium]MBP9843004.1 hypothetical protein [Candidatus Paceibacterota bacterium]